MKCPHCGMIIRDNITECGYCGGKIVQRPERAQAAGKPVGLAPLHEPGMEGDDEEEGGISRLLQPGEQVLIGSLNITVKKFFFHAYLTNQRIFLIDTQEKKLKVTAKDVPRDTVAGCIVEFSENSDPVLVVSIRSPDEEVKTMKMVFVQNGMDRSAEIDEWIALLQEEEPGKKPKRRPAQRAPEPEQEPEPEPEPELEPEHEEEKPEPEVRPPPRPPRQKPELRPVRKPTKDPERQPPVKRLLTMYTEPEEMPEPAAEPPEPVRRAAVRQVSERPKKPLVTPRYEAEVPAEEEPEARPVPKPEVQSAMKVAMKSAMRPIQQQHTRPVKRTVTAEPEREPVATPSSRRPVVHEPPRERLAPDEDAGTTTPQFCHNCGKKLPHAANFCPGCGTKLTQSRTLPQNRFATTVPEKRITRTDPPVHEPRGSTEDEFDDDEGGETPVVAKPPVKRAPKGSEMTILHKFLRR